MWTEERRFARPVEFVRLPNGTWVNPAAVISVELQNDVDPDIHGRYTVVLTLVDRLQMWVNETTVEQVISCLVQHDGWRSDSAGSDDA